MFWLYYINSSNVRIQRPALFQDRNWKRLFPLSNVLDCCFFFGHSVACHTQFDRIKCLRFFRSVFVCYACVCSINNEYEAKVMFIKLIEEFHIDNTYHTLKWVKCSGHKIKRKQKTLNERKQREKIHAYTHFMSVMKRWSLSFKYI